MEGVCEGPCEVLLMRHGERVDRVFGSGWARKSGIGQAESESQTVDYQYRPYDLNLPLWLPKRKTSWRNDAPLTEMGWAVGRAMGRSMELSTLSLSAIYASPALRCVQTATAVAGQLSSPPPIRVEPGLFEAVGWYDSLPSFLSLQEFAAAGYPVDKDYKPIMGRAELEGLERETNAAYAARTRGILVKLLGCEKESERVLLVAHAPSLALGSNLLCLPKQPLAPEDLHKAGHHFPFSCILSLQRPNHPTPAAAHIYAMMPTLAYNLTSTNNASAPDLAYLRRDE